ncbi:MAG: FkbM family methyltransferase [Candidatus Paceibacterota bacterium]|jgi:FkbM family methyltransferase
MSNLRKLLRNKFYSARNRLFPAKEYENQSYSQEGEDMVLNKIFGGKNRGFYVDVGAHHPYRFSNTYFFYKKGWRGINIDPNPGTVALFSKKRPRDINLEIGISSKNGTMKYYEFSEPALNSFSEALSQERNRLSGCRIVFIKEVPVVRLDKVLDENIRDGQTIDFMSIDVEGHELEVLKSNNWSKYRPTVILVEILDFDMIRPSQSEIFNLLVSLGYKLYAKTGLTNIFILKP